MNPKIIDFHVHAGKFSLLRDDIQGLLTKFPFEEEVDVRDIFSNPETLKNYLMLNGVERAVILAECGPGTNFSIDSSLILEFCRNDDFFIPFGSINPNHHDDPIGEWKKDKKRGIRGYKFYPADHDFNPFTDTMMSLYGLCEEASQPIIFHTGFTGQKDTEQKHIRPEEFRQLAERFEGLRIIFAHGGKPLWYQEAVEIATTYPNVYLDTALVPAGEVVNWLESNSAVKNKILFGSDLPVCGAYSAVKKKLIESGISADDLNKIFRGNAERLLAGIQLNQVEPEFA
ncbi:amidohydrolase family protein [Cellvibrio fibrivorans]|uniref:TIM-barrel fold metal-dependent hydrolase n=1 Tax=Cellvibrio fibrivorans TaxID=126350 RepID=A0ABU1UTP3_9GAMM|nr:amidohydrolase family protein [Cellvibrio fibrivorans]MDR7088563.1 putative TIM-barrel fold metal-dependent hydrolase [Cellvibrio fibrivorans]